MRSLREQMCRGWGGTEAGPRVRRRVAQQYTTKADSSGAICLAWGMGLTQGGSSGPGPSSSFPPSPATCPKLCSSTEPPSSPPYSPLASVPQPPSPLLPPPLPHPPPGRRESDRPHPEQLAASSPSPGPGPSAAVEANTGGLSPLTPCQPAAQSLSHPCVRGWLGVRGQERDTKMSGF